MQKRHALGMSLHFGLVSLFKGSNLFLTLCAGLVELSPLHALSIQYEFKFLLHFN